MTEQERGPSTMSNLDELESRPGDLDEEGIANLRKVFPAAIAKIEAEAAATERRLTVERGREAARLHRYRDILDPANGPEHRTGVPCIEEGCHDIAGTAWSAFWCPRHNAERMDRISDSLDDLATADVDEEAGNG